MDFFSLARDGSLQLQVHTKIKMVMDLWRRLIYSVAPPVVAADMLAYWV